MTLPEELGLAEGALVLVDSSALVYYAEGAEGGRRAAVGAFFEAARGGRLRLAASAVAWAELLAGAAGPGDAGRLRALLSDSRIVRIEVVDVAVAEEAARLMAALGRPARTRPALGFADALHIATAIVIGADATLTNDEAWREVPRCPRALLVDEIAALMALGEGS